jgi:MFS family permease
LRCGHLPITRAALGVSEAPAYPASTRVVANWFPPDSRGSPTGVYTAAAPLAPAIAPPDLTTLMIAFGWRARFITIRVVGIVFSVAWMLLYRGPAPVRLSGKDRVALD